MVGWKRSVTSLGIVWPHGEREVRLPGEAQQASWDDEAAGLPCVCVSAFLLLLNGPLLMTDPCTSAGGPSSLTSRCCWGRHALFAAAIFQYSGSAAFNFL